VKGLLLHKPNLMQSVPEPPSGRDGEQKFCQKFKNTKNEKNSELQEKSRKPLLAAFVLKKLLDHRK
jgi:hypothetical protein